MAPLHPLVPHPRSKRWKEIACQFAQCLPAYGRLGDALLACFYKFRWAGSKEAVDYTAASFN